MFHVFRDVLGMHEINHIAVARINTNNVLVSLSSTPAMEFNLFSSSLWRYDQTYNPKWFSLCTQSYWGNLYSAERYDELYYIKQIKHVLPLGLSLAGKIGEDHYIYCLASRTSCPQTQELFATQHEEFYKIGQYCSNMLNPLFSHCDAMMPKTLAKLVEYETSK